MTNVNTKNLMPLKYLTEDVYRKCYSDILHFRKVFNLPIDSPLLSANDYRLHCDLFVEEYEELASAIERKDKIDALVDQAYIYFGMLVHQRQTWDCIIQHCPVTLFPLESIIFSANSLDFNFLAAWDIVHESNLSKVCQGHNLEKTLQHYRDLGVTVHSEVVSVEGFAQESSLVKVTKLCKDWTGKIYPKGKILKSVDYVPADLSAL